MANEILTPAQMYEADALAAQSGMSSLKLMANAGNAVADEIAKNFAKCHVAILCGPGNNGGDGFVVAGALLAKKWRVTVFLLGERDALKGDSAKMAGKWKVKILPFHDFPSYCGRKSGPNLIVDALFGAGINRDLPDGLVDAVMHAKLPIVAIDIPSGLDGLTGCTGGGAIRADLTVTFFRKKPAHVLQPGRSLCGEIIVTDIGIPEEITKKLPVSIYENTAPLLNNIDVETHKFKRGHAMIWSGPDLQTGAARLAAFAAARSGCGLTTLAGSRSALLVHAQHTTSIMLRQVETSGDLSQTLRDKRITALCIGPAAGVNDSTRRTTLRILQSGIPIVLDADALSAFQNEPDELFTAIKAKPHRGVVMTPHEGEFRRVFGAMSGSKIERARCAAARSGAIIIYKGPDTVIANPKGEVTVNTNAPAKLATAGSGDVLAGIATGLLAQGKNAYETACAAVWLHAEAANRCSRRTLVAEDLIAELGY